MTTLRLERVARAHAHCLVEMEQEFRAEGASRFPEILEDVDAFFERTERFAEGRDLPPHRVQQTHFLLFEGDAAGRLLGGARLRHRLIPALHRDGGNIGYEIRARERRKGYATALLGMMLEEARRIGLAQVLLTAERTNEGSIRVIEKWGGVPDGEAISPNTGLPMLRYWIALPPAG